MNSKIIFLIFYSSVIIILFILIFGNKILPYFLSNTFIESIKILFYFSPYILIICFKPIIDKLIVFNGDSDALARRNIFNLFFTSILIYFLLENNFSYKFIPFCFLISELIILASYSLFSRTKYVFMEIKDGIFKFPLSEEVFSNRIDYFIIWPNGINSMIEIIDHIADNEFDILRIVEFQIHNMNKFLKIIYSHDYAPYFHLRAKLKYLKKLNNKKVIIIFVLNKNSSSFIKKQKGMNLLNPRQ